MPTCRRAGDRAVTESVPSKLVLVTEPLPTLTYRVPSKPITGPAVPVMPSGSMLPHGRSASGTGVPTCVRQTTLPVEASSA